MTGHWFKPQRYGYGAVPRNSKGWALICAFAVAIMAVALTPVAVDALTGAPMTPLMIVVWLVAAAVIVLGFVRTAKAHTNGEWRWRWGEEP
jgi:hypothetical protein